MLCIKTPDFFPDTGEDRASTLLTKKGIKDNMGKFTQALTVWEEDSSGFRLFNRLKCKDGKEISLQASRLHYCEPQETLPLDRLDEYASWEVAMFGTDDGWFIPQPDDPVYGKFADLYSGDDVAGRVPSARVQELYETACL